MSKLLIVVTRQEAPSEIAAGLQANAVQLYNAAGSFQAGRDRSIWVVPQCDGNYAGSLNGLHVNGQVGVVIHDNNPAAWNGHGITGVLQGEYKRGRYTTGETEKYGAHKALGHCVSGVQAGDVEALFDTFWNLCFKDPILEDLILLLQTHARKKSEGEPIGVLETLKTAVAGNVQGQAQGNGRTIADKAIELVSRRLADGPGYDALRTALVETVVARYENPNA